MDKHKILVVDDEPSVRLTITRTLEKSYCVIEAENGEEAIRIAKEQKPDLVLIDLMMPKMDGYTACSKIKSSEETKEIPVLILTAIGHELNKKYANEMGADGYITKPFTHEELLNTISQYIKTPI